MTNFAPLFLAFLLNCCGVHIFTRPKNHDNLPYLSYVIFLLSVSFLLCHACVIPLRFRKLLTWANFIVEFAIAMLLMEFIVNNIWVPLELGVLSFIQKLPHAITVLIRSFGFKSSVCDALEFLKSPVALWVTSYMLSIFCFICISQATRVLDFNILTECGTYYFVLDVADRAYEYTKEIMNSIFKNPCRRRRKRKVTFPRKDERECEVDDFDSDDFSSNASVHL